MNGVLIIAHAPLATALRECALHVFPDAGAVIAAVDTRPEASPEDTLASARAALQSLGTEGTLVLTDVFGATPSNVAQRLIDGERTRMLTGANLPMVVRALTYRNEPLESMQQRALTGATQGILAVAGTAPQNQPSRAPQNDQERHHHQQ